AVSRDISLNAVRANLSITTLNPRGSANTTHYSGVFPGPQMEELVNPRLTGLLPFEIFRECCNTLTNFYVSYSLRTVVHASRGDQTLLGAQRFAEHSTALRCHGVFDGASRASHSGGDPRRR